MFYPSTDWTGDNAREASESAYFSSSQELDSRVSRFDAGKKRIKSIVSAESKNKHFEEKEESSEVKNSGASVMAKETQLRSVDSINCEVLSRIYPLHSRQDEYIFYKRMMEMKGLRFELSVTSMLRATKFRPFQQQLCTPINCGSTLQTGPHMRGY